MSTAQCPYVNITGTARCLFITSHDGPCSWDIEDEVARRKEQWDHQFLSPREDDDAEIEMLMADPKYHTEQARHICEDLVPAWREGFIQKNLKYRKVDNSLGVKGIFPDVYRKTGILKDRIWDDGAVIGEGTEEVIQDLIGHLFLMLHMIQTETPNEPW